VSARLFCTEAVEVHVRTRYPDVELGEAEITAARDDVAKRIRAHLADGLTGARAMQALVGALTEDELEELIRNVANNIVQGLL
jgi:hypothetical protein